MAFSKSGVSKVAWPMRLGLIMALSPSHPGFIHIIFQRAECIVNAIGDAFKGHSPGSGRKRGITIAQFAALDPSCTAAYQHLHTRQNRDIRRKLARAASHAGEQTNMAGYKLATYQTSDGPRAGLVIDDKVFDAAKLTGKGAYATVLGILEDWKTAQGVLRKAAAAGKSRAKALPLGRTKLLAPVRWPSAIYCAGANYADHAAEMARRMNRPLEPDPHSQGLKAWHFLKAARALADPGATVKISGVSDQVDWEVELAAVIGRPAKNVSQEKALDYVAGYTAANALSARDLGRRPH